MLAAALASETNEKELLKINWHISLLLALLLELTCAENPCGDGRECVPRFLCKSGQVITDGADLIDIREHSFSSQCPREQDTIAYSELITIKRRQADDGSLQCGFLEICCGIRNKTQQTTTPEQYVKCGYRNPNGFIFKEDAISGNTEKTGEFPWMVAILHKKNDKFWLVCNGAIIAPTVILTAAHCVSKCKAENYLVRTVKSPEILLVDRFDKGIEGEEAKHQQLAVRRIRIHDQFDPKSLVNDVALLIVQKPGFEWQETVRPICLPKSDALFDMSRCLSLFWTPVSNGFAIKKLKAPVVSNSVCQQRLVTTRLGKYFVLDDSFICGQDDNANMSRSDCHDKGGAVLVCPILGENNRYYQVGIGAWGIGCDQEDVPDVYASIESLYRWIDYALDSEGIDARHYSHT